MMISALQVISVGTTGIISSLVSALQVIKSLSALQVLLLLHLSTTGNLCWHYRYYFFSCLSTTGNLCRHYRYYYFSVSALQVISVGTTGIITSLSQSALQVISVGTTGIITSLSVRYTCVSQYAR